MHHLPGPACAQCHSRTEEKSVLRNSRRGELLYSEGPLQDTPEIRTYLALISKDTAYAWSQLYEEVYENCP